jgi:CubicO group peptidase (beta-lactamase class C family)
MMNWSPWPQGLCWNFGLIVGACLEEVSMPFMFQTRRALSALGSLACATALVAAFVALSIASQTAAAAEAAPSETSIEQHIQALVPSLEDYISANMKSFPGLAIGIVAGNKLIYAKGFGVRAKGGNDCLGQR